MPNIIGFDTETIKKNNVHNFFCFTVYSEDLNLKMYSENVEDLKKLFCEKNKGSYIFAHNLEFDFGVIKDWLEEHFKIEIKYAKSRLIAIVLRRNISSSDRKKNKPLFTLLDSMNFFPMSLKKVGEIVKFDKLESPEYLGKRIYNTHQEMEYFMEYAMRDAIIVYKAMKLLFKVVEGNVSITLASTSLKYFRKTFYDYRAKHKRWLITDWLNEDIRESYFGGRVEAFYRGFVSDKNFGKINVYDFNSLYPYVMKKDMPDLRERPKIINGDYDPSCLGSALVKLKTNCEYPIFPIRTDKLRFPCGTHFGWFTIPELNEMIIRGEGKILKVRKSYNWKRVKSPFIEYVDYFFENRKIFKKQKNPIETIYKLMLNSLYGKWGEVLSPTSLKKIETIQDFSRAKDLFGDYGLFIEKERFTKHTFFPIASTITSYARLELHNMIHKVVEKKGKEIFYVDTDSVFTDAKLNTSDKLGDLKLEYTKDWFIFIRAKAYFSEDFVKLKGSKQGLNSKDIINCLNTDNKISMDQNRLVRFKESFRRINKKHLQEEFRKKYFSVDDDGKREYFRKLNAKKLLNTFSPSIPIGYK